MEFEPPKHPGSNCSRYTPGRAWGRTFSGAIEARRMNVSEGHGKRRDSWSIQPGHERLLPRTEFEKQL